MTESTPPSGLLPSELLTEAGEQLFWTLNSLILRPDQASFSALELRTLGQDRFREHLLNWDVPLGQLVERGLLLKDGHHFTFGPDAEPVLTAAMAHFFGKTLVGLAASPTFKQYNERVHGQDLSQFDMADMAQLSALLGALHLSPNDTVLDLGCGLGGVCEYLQAQSGAHFTGLDFAPPVIAEAHRRTAGHPRLHYLVGNMDTLDLPNASFDAITAVDTLYFARNLPYTVKRLAELLRPGGRMGLFWSVKPNAGQPRQGPDNTRLAAALKATGLPYTTTDFTVSELALWQRSLEAAEALEGEFKAEGLSDDQLNVVLEGRRMLENPEFHSRFLYVVQS